MNFVCILIAIVIIYHWLKIRSYKHKAEQREKTFDSMNDTIAKVRLENLQLQSTIVQLEMVNQLNQLRLEILSNKNEMDTLERMHDLPDPRS